ncbi:hypothetical protein CH64_1344 [Yersinia rohdei]|uniref:Uncharacterized protein n=1 Tax=Yersinia rohdei TaxID=29485 RepID=A0ABN4F3K6_YERRO|nr:hypothetical protein CH64_1344 [Yersinia rohdei]
MVKAVMVLPKGVFIEEETILAQEVFTLEAPAK